MVKRSPAEKRTDMMRKIYEGGYVMVRKSTIVVFFSSYITSAIIIAIVRGN